MLKWIVTSTAPLPNTRILEVRMADILDETFQTPNFCIASSVTCKLTINALSATPRSTCVVHHLQLVSSQCATEKLRETFQQNRFTIS